MMTRKLLSVLFCGYCLSACAQNRPAAIELTNPLNNSRDNELIVLTRKQLEHKLGKLKTGTYVAVYRQQSEPLTVQFDDLNQDGVWDEAVFLYSFKPEEKVKLYVQPAGKPVYTSAAALAHTRMMLKDANGHFGPSVPAADMPYQNPPTDFSKQSLPPYLTEGPGWENDKVAFRLYFDTRNNKDIYGKRVPGMVMDTVGANPNNSYHKLSGWGMDILRVGTSLGAGALAFRYTADGRDTLVRLGGQDIQSESYQQIADGPVRAVFNMNYTWQLANQPVKIMEQISIWGGQYFYQSRIFVDGKLPADLKVDMGIADFYQNTADSFSLGNAKVLYSYGKQSENHDLLGMAILAPQNSFSRFWQIGKKATSLSDITDTYLSEQQVGKKPALYRFYAAWEKSDESFASKDYFTKYMQSQAERFDKPVIIQ